MAAFSASDGAPDNIKRLAAARVIARVIVRLVARLGARACFGSAVLLALLGGRASAQQSPAPAPAAASSSSSPSTSPSSSPSAAASQSVPPSSKPPTATPGVIHPPATSAPMQPDRRQARPKTPEEAAAYQKIISEKSPNTQISAIEDFLLQYPESEMREYVFEEAMEAYHAKSDYNHMQTYGELTLAQNPDNLTALLELSSSLAETTGRDDPDRDDKLADGDEHAVHALAVLDQLHKPPGLPDEQWDRTRKEAQSQAHAARGLIALVRQDFEGAVTEIKQAVDLAFRPSAVLLYRLGLGYSFQQKYAEALEVLDRAAAMGGVKFTAGGKVRDLVAEAKEMAAKGLAAAPAPVQPTTPAPIEADPKAPSGEAPSVMPGAAPASKEISPVPPTTQPGSHFSPAGPAPNRIP